MKKLALVLCAGLFLATAANAQSLQLGVKAGANFSNVSGNGTQGVSTSTMVGFNAGAYLGIGISENFFIQPELVYSGQGFKESSSGYSGNQTENYLNIPVLAKYKLPVGLYFETGPQIGFLMSAKVSVSGYSASDKQDFNSTDFA
ncbi:MAG TPA: porin family protein, partial [Puia sp.]|nr:porin family protein [Puia sp.]